MSDVLVLFVVICLSMVAVVETRDAYVVEHRQDFDKLHKYQPEDMMVDHYQEISNRIGKTRTEAKLLLVSYLNNPVTTAWKINLFLAPIHGFTVTEDQFKMFLDYYDKNKGEMNG